MDDLVPVQTLERAEALPGDLLQAFHLLDEAVASHTESGWAWGA